MGGAELYKLLKIQWPELKVLFMSGYTPNSVVHGGFLADDVPYIQKPFRSATLAQKVREVLDS